MVAVALAVGLLGRVGGDLYFTFLNAGLIVGAVLHFAVSWWFGVRGVVDKLTMLLLVPFLAAMADGLVGRNISPTDWRCWMGPLYLLFSVVIAFRQRAGARTSS